MPDASQANQAPLERDKEIPVNAQHSPNTRDKSGSVPTTPNSSHFKSSNYPAVFDNACPRGPKSYSEDDLRTIHKTKLLTNQEKEIENQHILDYVSLLLKEKRTKPK